MKDFLLLSSINAITYKDFFPLLKEGKARGGYTFNKTMVFETQEGEKPGPNIAWFTSLSTPDKRKLILTKKYKHTEYPHYDNYNAIEVSRIKDIPYDYDCVMGVPITIFGYDLDNVEVLQLHNSHGKDPEWNMLQINGKDKYARILIKKKIEIMGLLENFKEEDCNETTGFKCGDDVSAYNLPGTQNGPVIITSTGPEAKYKRVLIRNKRSWEK